MDTLERVERLERRLKVMAAGLLLVGVVPFLAGWKAQQKPTDSLRIRQITIVDENDTERVWIGAPVPDPIVGGKQFKRSGPVSGIILLDAKGNERSGYVTSDQGGSVFLSLDSETEQQTLFLINPGGGGHLTIYDSNGSGARMEVLNSRPRIVL